MVFSCAVALLAHAQCVCVGAQEGCLLVGNTGKGGVAQRECLWVKAGMEWTHVTTAETPLGKEETRRTLQGPRGVSYLR